MPVRAFIAAITTLALAGPALAEGDAATGEKEFGKCRACHAIEGPDGVVQKGGKTGPNLYAVVGRTAGTADFNYGDDIKAAGEKGLVWDAEQLAAYIEDPRKFLQDYLEDKGAKSKMTFKMRKNAEDVAAYLATPEAGAAE